MKFVYGKQDMTTLERAQETCWLLTNGLGGYASASSAFSVTRCDQGLLIGAETAPNKRVTLVHRLSERLEIGTERAELSTQEFADGRKPERGYQNLSVFVWENGPRWRYEVQGVQVERSCAMEYGANSTAVVYHIENRSDVACTLKITPFFQFCAKGEARTSVAPLVWNQQAVICGERTVSVRTDGKIQRTMTACESLFYAEDAKDGRSESGLALSCFEIEQHIPPGEKAGLQIVFSMQATAKTGIELLEEQMQRLARLEQHAPFRSPAARQLVCSADAFIAERESTGGKTILAGYPYFGDWGRDTMIALPGCTLATGRYAAAKSILKTFLAYERDGLVPNLFPEGTETPRYNTADAALLLIHCVWLYEQKTGDTAFVREAWPVLVRIVEAYRKGTRHAIRMDEDGLIEAGEGLDQVTWMDVCVDGILPTPRHGKPVEINAYWYNALRIMQAFAEMLEQDGTGYAALAEKTRTSFVKKFWMPEQCCLKDVLSGTAADRQIRCNQIWAITMPFSMLSEEQERQVVDVVYRKLYTPCGLRTLAPEDAEFHPVYGGEQRLRDMAYHQGTAWIFLLGVYYRAYLKVHGNTPEAAAQVRRQLEAIEPMLREGCVGQLPEIYDGGIPGASKGCFAQAWSVGELLSVYEQLEMIEQKQHARQENITMEE